MDQIFTLDNQDIIFKRIHIIMIGLVLLLSSYIIANNHENKGYIALGCGIYLSLTVIRHLYLSKYKKNLWQWIFPYFEGIVLCFILVLDASGFGRSLFILVVWDIAIDYKASYAIVYSIFAYLIYMIPYGNFSGEFILARVIVIYLIGAFQFILYIGFAFLTKGYSIKTQELRKTSSELNAKMIAMEEMTVLKERNRIAVEIHNTVGHKLTTALVQIEAAQLVMDKKPEECKKRLSMIREQLRDGLQEIRNVIHAINADEQYTNFSQMVQRLLDQVLIHTKIQIDIDMDDIEETKMQLKKTLYHVIQESITNAIRHGQCHSINIRLTKEQGMITLSCFNDGLIPNSLKYGYGLSHIRDMNKELGGTFAIKMNGDNWFGIEVIVPVFYREGDVHEQNQSYVSR